MVLKYNVLLSVKDNNSHSLDMKICNHLFLRYGHYNDPVIMFHFRHSLLCFKNKDLLHTILLYVLKNFMTFFLYLLFSSANYAFCAWPTAHYMQCFVSFNAIKRESQNNLWTTWRRENSWPYRDSNSDSSIIQPVASRYTDYTIPAPIRKYMVKLNNTLTEDLTL
jgi:hypothetical protein